MEGGAGEAAAGEELPGAAGEGAADRRSSGRAADVRRGPRREEGSAFQDGSAMRLQRCRRGLHHSSSSTRTRTGTRQAKYWAERYPETRPSGRSSARAGPATRDGPRRTRRTPSSGRSPCSARRPTRAGCEMWPRIHRVTAKGADEPRFKVRLVGRGQAGVIAAYAACTRAGHGRRGRHPRPADVATATARTS